MIKNKIITVLCMFIILSSLAGALNFNIYFTDQDNTLSVISQPVKSSSVLFQITSDRPSICKYSSIKDVLYDSMEGSFDANLEMIHKKTLINLEDKTYHYYVRCKDFNSTLSSQLEAVFSVQKQVSAQISLSSSSPLKAGKYDISLATTKIVQNPSLAYSFDGISYNYIPLYGSGMNWNGHIIIPNDVKEEIGSFKFQATDLEGNVGTEITAGSVFLVDNIKPDTTIDIEAEGNDGSIILRWKTQEDIKDIKIFRSSSPNVEYSSLHKTILGDSSSYVDTSVERGKTYYYRISMVDKAENEGDLSREVYATSLFNNISQTNYGLETRYVGFVDNLLVEVDSLDDNIRSSQNKLSSGESEKREVYSALKLDRDVESARSEITSLRRDITNLKQQSLTKSELDSKIDSFRLKLQTIKRKVPDDIIIDSSKTVTQSINERDIEESLLRLYPASSEKSIKKSVSQSMAAIKNGFEVSSYLSNVVLVYLDGSRKETSFVKETIKGVKDKNMSIVEIVPIDLANSASDINVKNQNYNIEKEDTILSFTPETVEIIYSFEGHKDINGVDKIRTLPSYSIEYSETEEDSLLTGYLSFVNIENANNVPGILLGIILIGATIYMFVMKRQMDLSESLLPLKQKISALRKSIQEGNGEEARRIYASLAADYKLLPKKQKNRIYDDLTELSGHVGGMT